MLRPQTAHSTVCGWSWAKQMLLLSFQATQLQSNSIVFEKRHGSLQLRLLLLSPSHQNNFNGKKKAGGKTLIFHYGLNIQTQGLRFNVLYWNWCCVSWFIGIAVPWSLDLSQANTSYHFTIFFFSLVGFKVQYLSTEGHGSIWVFLGNLIHGSKICALRSAGKLLWCRWRIWCMFSLLYTSHTLHSQQLWDCGKPAYLGNTEPLLRRTCSQLVWFWCSVPARLYSLYQPKRPNTSSPRRVSFPLIEGQAASTSMSVTGCDWLPTQLSCSYLGSGSRLCYSHKM